VVNGKLEFFAERNDKAIPLANLWINTTNPEIAMFELQVIEGKISDHELVDLCDQLREAVQMVRHT
jgi:hypothetical protein